MILKRLIFIICLGISSLSAQEYIVFGWSDLGMHSATKNFQTMVIYPPFNNLRAQVIRVGTGTEMPELLTENIRVHYAIPGNTYSAGKTNFWDYTFSLFGREISADVGLTGAMMNGEMQTGDNYFFIDGIPLTPYQDDDLQNEDPYQLAELNVYNASNQLIGTSAAVVPVSNEITCTSTGCHGSETSILRSHEQGNGFDRFNTPIMCISCHPSKLEELPGMDELESFSEVIHDKHKERTTNCYKCHPGNNTQFFRGVMASQNLKCQDCHGSLSDVAESIKDGRRPWEDEPSCASGQCHDARFSEEPGKLFKDSKGHGGLYCSACHGAPHAITPSGNQRDNQQMIAIAGEAGPPKDCRVCHGVIPAGPGPHGMHPFAADFDAGLHATRRGMNYWYGTEQGGFETMTNLPMESLDCQQCHGPVKANGTPVDPAGYTPGCNDCHDYANVSTVESGICLGCHERQQTEIELAATVPDYTDVHRTAGMECTDCHDKSEFHLDGTAYNSLHESGAVRASCDLEACHPANAMNNDIPSHSLHQGKVHCNACHVQTVSTCYNCHFESMAVSGTARYYGDEPAHGFVMLVNSDKYGQVSTASYQTLTFGDSAFYAIAPDFSHTISTTARTCLECHKNESVNEYFNTGNITVTDWDETSMGLTHRQGAIPVSPDWQTSLKFDFLTYTGSANDPAGNGFDPAKWTFLKSQTDRAQMLFASPLTTEQMNALVFIFNRVTDEIAAEMPLTYQLEKNHPNPFNPSTRISFQLPYDQKVRLVIYNALGQKIRTLVDSDFQPGHYQVEWNGNDSQDNAVASGIYFYRMDAGSFSEMKKMILLR